MNLIFHHINIFFGSLSAFLQFHQFSFGTGYQKKLVLIICFFFSCFTVTLGVLFLFFGNKLNFFFISCLLYGLGVPGSVALILVEGKKRFVGNINTSVAILTSAFSIGQILGPYLSGILIDTENEYKSSIILAFVCLILSSFLMIDPKRLRIFKS